MDIIDKALPFLAAFPRWLQVFSFAVLLQVSVLAFLIPLYSLRVIAAKNRPPVLTAEPLLAVAESVSKNSSSHPPGPRNSLIRVTTVLRQADKFPLADVTLVNASENPLLLIGFDLDVIAYSPYAALPTSRVLVPLASVDIALPLGTGHFPHRLLQPVLVGAKDAATITFRFFVRYDTSRVQPHEVARYEVVLLLRADDGTSLRAGPVSF